MRYVQRLLAYSLLGFNAACVSPAQKAQQQAEQLGMQTLSLPGGNYKLTAYYKPSQSTAKTLHVYLEGDGSPWLRGVWPAAEPTTRDSLMLALLAIDEAPGLYLARPCYNGHAEDRGCEPSLWTSARYSEQIVTAMTAALDHFCRSYSCQQILLIGHSGGGALAMLMSTRLARVRGVVTLAGNYDIDVWADHHGYLKLHESLNPAQISSPLVEEWHFLGADDTNIPPELFLPALRKRKQSHVVVLPKVSHKTGWQQVWPQILKSLTEK